jgi:hypothetical protein
VAVLSRLMAGIFIELVAGIDVPGADIADGRTVLSARLSSAENPRDRPLVRILSGPAAPAEAFSAVHYRNS